MNALLAVCMLLLPHHLTVAPDGSGDFTSIQAAVNAVPYGSDSVYTITIRKGVYRERLRVAEGKDHIHLVGDDGVRITYGLHTGLVLSPGDTISTWNSASVTIDGYAFRATNITFGNDAPPGSGQAVAVEVSGDRAAFDHCRFLGNQDVLFCQGPATREAYEDCYIEGTTDFIFGAATVLFDRCEIRSKRNSYVTAPSTPRESPYGFVFLDCRLTADTGINKVFLGRPWRPYGSSTFIRCSMGAHIVPEGWYNWKKPANERTARFAEYGSTGPGAAPAQRVSWSRQLKAADDYTPEKVLNGWKPFTP